MVMFGLGGIYVEVLKDISFRIVPVNLSAAHEMIGENKGNTAFKGCARGKTRGYRHHSRKPGQALLPGL